LFFGFRGTHQPDTHDEADFDIPNTQAVLEKIMSNMCKLEEDVYQSLSVLLDSLPDPSRFSTVKFVTAAEAREKGVIPEAQMKKPCKRSVHLR
jgi:hypothetical protein